MSMCDCGHAAGQECFCGLATREGDSGIVPHGDPDPVGVLRAAIHSALGCLSNNEPEEAERVLLWAQEAMKNV